jgi:hypothetical protein
MSIPDELRNVLEATGFLDEDEPGAGVALGKAPYRSGRDFQPDAIWRSASSLRVYFKFAAHKPSTKAVTEWRREIWNEGFAPLLWVVGPSDVSLYDGYARPDALDEGQSHLLLTLQSVGEELRRLDEMAGRLSMETGHFWSLLPRKSQRSSVDRQLLADLSSLESALMTRGLDQSRAQAMVQQVIFAQYLIDRDIVTKDRLSTVCGMTTLSDALKTPASAHSLFGWLTDTLDGDVFTRINSNDLLPRFADILSGFLDGVEPTSGQMRLFPYKFDIVPVELISAIYEQFAHSADGAGATAKQTSLHYTRLAVVSLVLDEAMRGVQGSESVLDLTCGSGVFLVESLRRLVEARARTTGTAISRTMIRSVLHGQLTGVDISEAAIRVAAFSLCLAALELDPDPQPVEDLEFQPLIGKSLLVADARDVELFVDTDPWNINKPRLFDIVVGNPPWSFEGRSDLRQRRKAAVGRVHQGRGQSIDFVVRAAEFGHGTTRYGLVLSAMPFFATSGTGSKAARAVCALLTPVTIVNLAAHRGWLFDTAKMPAVVFLARCREGRPGDIAIVTVPWTNAAESARTFVIAPRDISWLELRRWDDDPTSLKAVAFGVGRDSRVLADVRSTGTTLGEWLYALGTSLQDGLQLGETLDASGIVGLPLLDSDARIGLRVERPDKVWSQMRAHRPRSVSLYQAPLLVVRELMEDGPRVLAGVADEDMAFTEAFFGAPLPPAMAPSGLVVASILRSALASWFFLLTASEFGIWKRRLFVGDVARLPLPHGGSLAGSPQGRAVLDRALSLPAIPSTDQWEALDGAVFDLYGLSSLDRVVIRDGLERAAWQWKKGAWRSEAPATAKSLEEYADVLLKRLNAWAQPDAQAAFEIDLLAFPVESPIRIVRVAVGTGPAGKVRFVEPDHGVAETIAEIGRHLNVPLNSHLVGERDLRVYGSNEVYFIKPAAWRHWMASVAVADADEVLQDSIDIGASPTFGAA